MRRAPLIAVLLTLAIGASATVIYEARISKLPPFPSKWAWFYFSLPSPAKVSGPGNSGYVTLDTTALIKIQAGWGKQLTANLNRYSGYIAIWQMKLIKEAHSQDGQRAGMSVFVLSSDHYGVEVGYWNDRIFVYNDDKTFTPGESARFDPRAKMSTYRLSITGDRYSLTVDGTTRLQGKLRNYSSFGFPYTRPNSIWYGDDSKRGASVSQWASFEIR